VTESGVMHTPTWNTIGEAGMSEGEGP